MRTFFPIIFLLLLTTSCQQEVEPTIENINSIFETKDFSVEMFYNDKSYRLSFRDDFMTYVSPKETQRKTISYDEAALVNAYVQNEFRSSLQSEQKGGIGFPFYKPLVIYNNTKKVTLSVPDTEENEHMAQLLNSLNLNYVPTQEK